ncbi:MAG: hypothetical protein KGI37_02305 [Alphaproteobacteria bacterium]|nr:hypothetical protein [Alphaproteobacteria bacterium]
MFKGFRTTVLEFMPAAEEIAGSVLLGEINDARRKYNLALSSFMRPIPGLYINELTCEEFLRKMAVLERDHIVTSRPAGYAIHHQGAGQPALPFYALTHRGHTDKRSMIQNRPRDIRRHPLPHHVPA